MICKRKLENTIFTNRLTPVAQKEQKCWKILNEMFSKIKRRKNCIEETMETRKKRRKNPCNNLRGIFFKYFSFVSER
jgi:hypothetical protein